MSKIGLMTIKGTSFIVMSPDLSGHEDFDPDRPGSTMQLKRGINKERYPK